MSQTIYKMFMVRPSQAFHALSKEEQDKLLAKVDAALTQVGGKRVVLCNSAWASEQWPGFGVEQFPSLEAQQQHTKLLQELNWPRYIESMTLLGTEMTVP